MHRGHHQVALVLAVVVVGDHDDLAAREGLDGCSDARLRVGHQTIDPLLRRNQTDEVIGRHRAAGRFGDTLGQIERGEVAFAELRDPSGRNLDRPGKVGAGGFGLLQPIRKLHPPTLAWLKCSRKPLNMRVNQANASFSGNAGETDCSAARRIRTAPAAMRPAILRNIMARPGIGRLNGCHQRRSATSTS